MTKFSGAPVVDILLVDACSVEFELVMRQAPRQYGDVIDFIPTRLDWAGENSSKDAHVFHFFCEQSVCASNPIEK